MADGGDRLGVAAGSSVTCSKGRSLLKSWPPRPHSRVLLPQEQLPRPQDAPLRLLGGVLPGQLANPLGACPLPDCPGVGMRKHSPKPPSRSDLGTSQHGDTVERAPHQSEPSASPAWSPSSSLHQTVTPGLHLPARQPLCSWPTSSPQESRIQVLCPRLSGSTPFTILPLLIKT